MVGEAQWWNRLSTWLGEYKVAACPQSSRQGSLNSEGLPGWPTSTNQALPPDGTTAFSIVPQAWYGLLKIRASGRHLESNYTIRYSARFSLTEKSKMAVQKKPLEAHTIQEKGQ